MNELDKRISEAEWQVKVIETAQLHGWMVFHAPKANTAEGWRTPVAADGKGFPDLLLVSRKPGGGVLFRELKTEVGKLEPAQFAWGVQLDGAGADWAVWRPRDWKRVLARLSYEEGS